MAAREAVVLQEFAFWVASLMASLRRSERGERGLVRWPFTILISQVDSADLTDVLGFRCLLPDCEKGAPL
jgi:hypothetical protein